LCCLLLLPVRGLTEKQLEVGGTGRGITGGWGDDSGSPKFHPGQSHVGFDSLRTERGLILTHARAQPRCPRPTFPAVGPSFSAAGSSSLRPVPPPPALDRLPRSQQAPAALVLPHSHRPPRQPSFPFSGRPPRPHAPPPTIPPRRLPSCSFSCRAQPTIRRRSARLCLTTSRRRHGRSMHCLGHPSSSSANASARLPCPHQQRRLPAQILSSPRVLSVVGRNLTSPKSPPPPA
jgi:hypothetical protein